MIDLQQIRELDLETVEPGHFVELGNEVVQALRAELGDEALKSIYDTARGEGPDGFGERFAEALERYTDLHGELFDITEAAAGESDSLQDQGIEENIQESLEDLRAHYQEMRDTHLSRNIFVSWEKLRVDIEARKNDEVGADGKYKVSGGTIAVDVLGIIRGNIFETLLEEVLRGILDAMFPAEKDPVTMEEDVDSIVDETPDVGADSVFMDQFGVQDSGFVENSGEIDREMVSTMRSVNPLYGQHFGFDMTKDAIQNGSMKIWRGGFYQNIDTVINGEVRTAGVPRISMVELGQNLYHVSPFGRVLNSEIRNPKTEIPIGNTIARLDIASGQRREVFEAKAAELGCTLEQLKEHYTKEVEADFVERTEKKLSDHEIYLKDTVLPELEQLIDDFEKDHFFIESREAAIKTELESHLQNPEDADKRQELEAKLEKVSELKSAIEEGISRAEDREAAIKDTIDKYEDCKEALHVPEADVESRYMLVSNIEKDSAGRTEVDEYVPKDVEKDIQNFLDTERDAFAEDIERYNEEHPDNQLIEKDGTYYNRYGISETGDYDPEMCDESERPETEDADELREYISIHEEDGFSEFKEYLQDYKSEDVESPENRDIESDRKAEEQDSDRGDPVEKESSEVGNDEREAGDTSNHDMEITEESEERNEDVEQKKKNEEGGFDGDIPDIEAEEVQEVQEDQEIPDTVEEHEEQKVDPTEAAIGQDEISKSGGEEEKADDEDEEETERKEEDVYDDIIDGFREYLDNDTYSFGGDLVDKVQDVDVQVVDRLMSTALSELYMETDMSDNARLFSLTAEVAAYSENGIMPSIENLVEGLRENGMTDSDIAMTLEDMEPYIIRGMDELVTMSADDVEQRTIRIGDDIWTVTNDSIVNDVTGQEEDPNDLVDLIVKSVNDIYGDGVGDVAAEQAVSQLDESTGKGIDFLDVFFNSSLESTLQDMMEKLIPDGLPDTFEGVVESDQSIESMAETEQPEWSEIPEIEDWDTMEDIDGVGIEDL